MEPTELSLELLQDMTDNFSEQQKLGQGAYGMVYRGVDRNGQEVAVKLLHDAVPGLRDEEFKNEFENLKKLNHPHIMKLIGFCYETKHRPLKHNGTTIFVDKTYRAFCLEYLHHGSLQNFLSEEICDGRLDWHTRFKIIKGAWEGLKYLHEELKGPIYHLDLKPDNILLDTKMVPKLADFGLSKIFGGEQTRITLNLMGTPGYMPPEYIDKGLISNKFDIYSMGVVMIKTISGLKGYSRSYDMPADQFIDQVLGSWRLKLQKNWSGSLLEAYCQQVKRCMEIALKCVEVHRQNRPNIVDIVHELRGLETADYKISRCLGSKLLSVYPFHLVFPSVMESDKQMIACPLHLTNNTDDNIRFRLLIPGQQCNQTRFKGMLSGTVPPRTNITHFLTLLKPERKKPWSVLPAQRYELFTLEFWRQRQEDDVHQMKLVARYERPRNKAASSEIIILDRWVKSIDVHPSKPWILLVDDSYIRIYNYETQEDDILKNGKSMSQRDETEVTLAKFIARKKWFVAGNSAGGIYVYSYERNVDDPKERIHHLKQAHFESIVSFAIHPAEPYMLSASKDGYIKLWDYENGLKVMRVFGPYVSPWQKGRAHRHVAFNPKDASIFVSVQDNRIKIWNLHLSGCTWSMESSEPLSMNCLNFFNRGDKVFLIGGFSEGIIKLWDFQSMECVKTLETPYPNNVSAACSHPELPILIAGSEDGTICLWNSTNFRLERTLSFGLGSVEAINCLKGSRWIVIKHFRGIAWTKIGPGETGTSTKEAP